VSLLTDLESAWELNEASSTALDSHGSNDLTDVTGVGSGTGLVYGTARDLERSNADRFTRASNSSLEVGDIDFTLESWVNLESLSRGTIVTKSDGGNGAYFLLYETGVSRFRFQVYGGGGFGSVANADASTFGAISTATWYHVIAWHDSVNNEIGISVNDVDDVTAHSAGVYEDGSMGFTLGSDPFGNAFDGRISPVRFWKKVLTSGERTQLFNSSAGLTYAGLTPASGNRRRRVLLCGGR
jgi:hypothetical protein